MTNDIFTDIHQFEKRLSIPSGFYVSLLKEDDWSFVIKISAMLEASCTHILATKFHRPDLEGNLAYLDQANSKVGRIAFLKKLGALYKEQVTILKSVAELRNKLVHDVENVAFEFNRYIATLDKNQKANFVRDFGHGVQDHIRIRDKTISRDSFVLENPKLAIWLTVAEIIACLYLEIGATTMQLKHEALDEYINLTKTSARTN